MIFGWWKIGNIWWKVLTASTFSWWGIGGDLSDWALIGIPLTQYSGSSILSHGRITLWYWARLCDCFWPMNWKQEWFVSLQDPAPNCFWELPFPCVMAGIAQGSSYSEAWLADGLQQALPSQWAWATIRNQIWAVSGGQSSVFPKVPRS